MEYGDGEVCSMLASVVMRETTGFPEYFTHLRMDLCGDLEKLWKIGRVKGKRLRLIDEIDGRGQYKAMDWIE